RGARRGARDAARAAAALAERRLCRVVFAAAQARGARIRAPLARARDAPEVSGRAAGRAPGKRGPSRLGARDRQPALRPRRAAEDDRAVAASAPRARRRRLLASGVARPVRNWCQAPISRKLVSGTNFSEIGAWHQFLRG